MFTYIVLQLTNPRASCTTGECLNWLTSICQSYFIYMYTLIPKTVIRFQTEVEGVERVVTPPNGVNATLNNVSFFLPSEKTCFVFLLNIL